MTTSGPEALLSNLKCYGLVSLLSATQMNRAAVAGIVAAVLVQAGSPAVAAPLSGETRRAPVVSDSDVPRGL